MASKSSPAPFRLNSVDRLGRDIDPAVLAAAEQIFQRAFEHGLQVLGDPAVVVGALEEVAAEVSRLLARNDPPGDPAPPIRNLPGYIFRAFVRHTNRLKGKQPVLVGRDGQTLGCADPSRQFENKILVDECLAQCDFVARDMFWRKAQGFTWEDIGKIHGLSGHAAEVRFQHALHRAQARLRPRKKGGTKRADQIRSGSRQSSDAEK